jgi:ferredoxin-NADP reductase
MPSDHEYHALRVAAVVDETPDTRSFVLDIPPELRDTFRYRAGQFCMFRATIEGARVVRSYSMSSSPDAGERFTTTVKRVAGGCMSNWMNDALAPGDRIEVMRPSGLFVLDDTNLPLVAFAAGSGITPVISIIKTALVTTERRVRLIYANRGADSVIFDRELRTLEATHGARLTVHHHLDADRGFLDDAQCAALAGDEAHAEFYVCGPAPFMDTVQAGLARLGVGRERVHIERFEPVDTAPATTPESATESLVIRIERRRHEVAYQPGETILEAARRAGLRPPFSCEAGNCATCMARVETGAATLRANNALTDAELADGWVLTCQALPTSREIVVNYDA